MPYLSIDLEMTGTEPGWHEIIQIGAILFDDDWNELGTYLSNVYPENEESFSIPAQRVHDLSMDDLDDAPMLHEVIEEFEGWIAEKLHIRSQDPDKWRKMRGVIICGQSVINDMNFLKFAYRQEKLKWPFSNKILDLYNIALFLFPILQNNGIAVPDRYSLDAISKFFGFAREGEAHNALEDAILTADCLKEVMKYQQKLKLV
jgi:DNA polymerase-3 subunit epsilon